LKVLLEKGIAETDVVVVDLDDNDEVALNVSLNNPTIQGEFTKETGGLLKSLEGQLGNAFKELRMDELRDSLSSLIGSDKEPSDADPQIDQAPKLNEKWQVQTGDLWAIGEHRLLCGDSTKRESVARVMGGEKAQATVTDPPYNVTKEEWDRLPLQDELDIWLEQATGSVVAFGAAPPRCIVGILALKPLCERIYVWWNTFTLTSSEGAFWQWQPIYVWRREFMTGLERDVIQIAANTGGGKRMHVTQKPVLLMIRLVEATSKTGQLIYEPFLGSGTTMVACENLGRKCRGLEISPDYCAVILERMTTAFPQLKIERLQTGA
jgi:DNA modification methylase